MRLAGWTYSYEKMPLEDSVAHMAAVGFDGLELATGEGVDLFHPRRQSWQEHLAWAADGLTVVGRTPTGRATVVTLDLNARHRRTARRAWRRLGLLPGRTRRPAGLLTGPVWSATMAA